MIGVAFGSILRERYELGHPVVALGRDARTHSPQFEHATMEGLKVTGCKVLLTGQVPSPLNYFTVCTRHLDGSIQITASHNPPEDTGLKLQTREAEAFCGDELQELRKRIEHGECTKGEGSVEEIDAATPYIAHLTKLFARAGVGLSIVVDSGNGVAGPVYCEVLRRTGCRVTGLYTEPDGTFPHHLPDPAQWDTLQDLQEEVKRGKADCGLAFDGDGDRVGLVDEKGAIRTSDELLLLLARDHLERHPGAPIVFTTSNSSILETEITAWGGHPIMCKVGHSFVELAMRKEGSLLGGEQSGHFFCFEDYFGFDDALVTALRALTILRQSQPHSISELLDTFPKVYQAPERRPHCPDEAKGRIVQAVTEHFAKHYPVNTLDGARIDFGDGAWAGIRQSNTSPCLSICIEARSPEKLRDVEAIVLEHLRRAYPEMTL
jgi:phosphomannomutase/phosphoglucomutase